MYECNFVKPEPVVLAVTSALVAPADVPARILPMFDVVYAWLKDSGVEQTGHNYAIYELTADGLQMQAGFPVSRPFPDGESVRCLHFEVPRAAHTVHRGEYGRLLEAYRELRSWCAAQRAAVGEVSWEVYGDWNDDPSQLRTEVFLQVQDR